MAIYHLNVRPVSRADGGNAVAAAAYAIGQRLVDENTGEAFDYARKERVVASGTVIPKGAPEALRDPQALWSAAEAIDQNSNARPARRWDAALPRDLPLPYAIALAKAIASSLAKEGMCVTWAVHDYGDGNPHVHFVTTTRPLSKKKWDAERPETSFAKTKTAKAYLVRGPDGHEEWMLPAELKAANDDGADLSKVFRWTGPDGEVERLTMAEGKAKGEGWARKGANPVSRVIAANDWDTTEALERWRALYEDQTNDALARYWEAEGLEGEAPRIDRRSYAEQGIDKIPQMHEGPRPSDAVVAYNVAVRERNAIAAKLADAIRDVARRASAWWRRRKADPLTERRRYYARRQRRRGIAATRSAHTARPIRREQAQVQAPVRPALTDPKSRAERAKRAAVNQSQGIEGQRQKGISR